MKPGAAAVEAVKIMQTERRVIRDMTTYFGTEREALEWYGRPWTWLDHKNGRCHISPREAVESGRADEVLKLLKLFKG